MTNDLRLPAVPLITIDPYVNVWSMADCLTDDATRHWTGRSQSMTGLVTIDGRTWRFMGEDCSYPPIAQTGLKVTPLSTTYTFEASGVELSVCFTTPLLPDELTLLARPAAYMTMEAKAKDGLVHQVGAYVELGAEWCVNTPDQPVEWERVPASGAEHALKMGVARQQPLARTGDLVQIDWGYVYLALPQWPEGGQSSGIGAAQLLRRQFADGGLVEDEAGLNAPLSNGEGAPAMAVALSMSVAGDKVERRFIVVAYDDVESVQYFESPLKGYWRKEGHDGSSLIAGAIASYGPVIERCRKFDEEMTAEAFAAGGARYADVAAVSYRQAIASHKLVADGEGNALFFSKECFSNGCIGTVDVSYPAMPLLLLVNPELAKATLRPVFKYAASPQWPFDFAPHDVGVYPQANGQVYGDNKLEFQMPVEECGNMLIMTAAVCLTDGDAGFARPYWPLLLKWAEYLERHGLDPDNQLCSDDFAGHLARNANLSLKTIMALGGFALLCRLNGEEELGGRYERLARGMADDWLALAGEGDHYRLTFDRADSWSLKYNLVWDDLFGLKLFPDEVKEAEAAYYLTRQNRYGIPLDSRESYTKADWLVWAATLTRQPDQFAAMIAPLWDFLNETSDRVPFCDWYDTAGAEQIRYVNDLGPKLGYAPGQRIGFQNRPVVGGVFIKMLDERQRRSGSLLQVQMAGVAYESI